ncbi:MAG: dTDP-4-dehydrorhamnose reductase [Hyphomonadaceae bacterium]|nr:dTDP-4-dehydrorhamnose reductase [Hyphomonadaceae bacterium]
MRLVVTGTQGQVARALAETQAPGMEIVAIGRPAMDLLDPASVTRAIRKAAPDVVVNAAAYTAVDDAEKEREAAFAINEAGARAVAQAAAALGAPVIQLSTDYVFDGAKAGLYVESDPTGPVSVYGASKLAGEHATAGANANHVILRCAWVYSPFGKNFVRTMLRLAETREELGVVADQRGGPTSAHDIAGACVRIALNLLMRPDESELRGVFHLAPQGEAVWADFAEAIFAGAEARGAKGARVKRISTADYPTPAKRPANSRLDASKLAGGHGVRLPDWRQSLDICLDRLIAPKQA